MKRKIVLMASLLAGVVAAVGLLLVPFLPYLVKKPGAITQKELVLYYLIFLFNTVTTYFVAYKYSLVNAEQKNYIQTNINTITKIASILFQILVLVLTRSFLLFLLTDAAVQLIQKLFLILPLQLVQKVFPVRLLQQVQTLFQF